jgi:hypothetical protein
MKKISLIFVVIAVLALVLVGACGGDGDDETSAAQTSAQTSNPTTQPSSSEPETTTTESSGGNGGGFTWDDVPIYGGADQIQEFNISIPPEEGEYSRVEWRYYETGDDIDDVVDFYRDKMPDKGWDEIAWMDMMEIAYGMYMKNDEADAAMVWLSSTNGDTQIALWRASE